MTAPDPQSSNVIQKHIAKRAPSRHDNTELTTAKAIESASKDEAFRASVTKVKLTNVYRGP